jgi:hypothetical protein
MPLEGPLVGRYGRVEILRRKRTKPSAFNGKDRNRRRVRSKTALEIAGATQIMGVSPAPAEGRSGRSSSTTSMGGTSVVGERSVRDDTMVEANGLEQSTAQGHDRGPLNLIDHRLGVYYGSAFVRGDEAHDLQLTFDLRDLGDGRHPPALLDR